MNNKIKLDYFPTWLKVIISFLKLSIMGLSIYLLTLSITHYENIIWGLQDDYNIWKSIENKSVLREQDLSKLIDQYQEIHLNDRKCELKQD